MSISRRGLSIAAAAFAAVALSLGAAAQSLAAVATGSAAPAFSAVDTNGQTRTLAEFSGKLVVLEWTNHDCPFVQKHYETNNMQGLQRQVTQAGGVWLSIISSAPGKQGYVAPARANELTQTRNAAPTAVLLDPQGTVGRAYGARTTPHIFIIEGGEVVYQGAIDDNPSRSQATVATARNHVREALADIAANREIRVATTQPYGCDVKY